VLSLYIRFSRPKSDTLSANSSRSTWTLIARITAVGFQLGFGWAVRDPMDALEGT
jgi:hypothetical protein